MSILAVHVMLQALVAFTTVAQGAVSAIDEPRHVIVRTSEQWRTLWTTHSPRTPIPTVDFTRAIVVGVFLGTRPTDGFVVEITAVRQENDRYIVEYREHQPDPANLVAQVVTSPFHLATVPNDADAVEFRRID